MAPHVKAILDEIVIGVSETNSDLEQLSRAS